jgi:hypothetical protein
MPKDTFSLTPLQAIDTHPRLQPRAGMRYAEVRRYAALMRKGQELPPLILGKIGKKLYVIDGHHRLEAAHLAGLKAHPTIIRPYRTLDDAHRAVMRCNQEHGIRMSSADKQHAFAEFIAHNLHLHPSGAVKSVRAIQADFPFYSAGHIWKKLKSMGITAPRDDMKPYNPDGREWDGPSEEDLAEEEAIALHTIRDRLAEAQTAWALLSPQAREVAREDFRSAWDAVQSTSTSLLDI